MIDPLDIRTWPEDARRRHRLRRAAHELMSHPGYHMHANGDRLIVGPQEYITPEAEAFIRQYKHDLLTHCQWLEAQR